MLLAPHRLLLVRKPPRLRVQCQNRTSLEPHSDFRILMGLIMFMGLGVIMFMGLSLALALRFDIEIKLRLLLEASWGHSECFISSAAMAKRAAKPARGLFQQ